jgi:putative nucleotidyltransferase with HDIG domain
MNGQSAPHLSLPELLRINKSMEKERREQEKSRKKGWAPFEKEWLGFSYKGLSIKAVVLLGVSLIASFLLTPSFTSYVPTYRLGDIADRNIKSKRDFLIEDTEATAKKRDEAVQQSPLVYDFDENVAQQMQQRVEAAFQTAREAKGETASRSLDLLNSGRHGFDSKSAGKMASLQLPELSKDALQQKREIEGILGIEMPNELFSDLLETHFNQALQKKIVKLLSSSSEQGIVPNKTWSLQARGEDILIRKLVSRDEYISPPPHSYPDIEEARKFARMQALEMNGDPKEMRIVAILASQLLRPNLTFNLIETERRREQAYASVKPVYIHIARNEMLVREGQKIGPEELLKLKAHEPKGSSGHMFMVFLALFLTGAVCIWVFVTVARQHIASYRLDLRDFIFLGVLLLFLLTLGRIALLIGDTIGDSSSLISGRALILAVPLTAGAMMAAIFFDVTVSLIYSLLLVLFAGSLFGKDFGLFIYFLIGSFVASHCVSVCRTRMVPIRAGLLVGCSNIVLIILNALLVDKLPILGTIANCFFGLFGGVLAGVFVTGLTPLAELVFGYTTDNKLLELATMDQPLLQELMVQAPGTYHHSIIVGNMVEASAKSIGANALLAKVAAYYHDVGKIRKSLYFIENQFDCENRHEKLAPSMSSLILISHVKEGVEAAKQHRLGKAITEIIRQHHGSSLISFFYKKALEAREKAQTSKGAELPPVNIDDYRYPGPKPQTKEAGLVMLADAVEAACRSLTDPTPARIQGMVNRLINSIFSDGQLDECELTLKDLHHIAKHFNQILATVHHKRIEYPDNATTNGKGKADAPDSSQRESRSDRDKAASNKEGSRTDLKRLGIH